MAYVLKAFCSFESSHEGKDHFGFQNDVPI